MKNAIVSATCIVFLVFGCVQSRTETRSTPSPQEPIHSLPADQLAEFNDDFSTFRDDLWEKSYHLFREQAKKRFAAADIEVQSGQLVFTTKKGELSSAVMNSRFLIGGDFDFQTDITIDFDPDIPMRQMAHFSVFHEGLEATLLFLKEKRNLMLKVRRDKVSVGRIRGRTVKQKKFDGFSGSLRAVRRAEYLTLYYRDRMDGPWQPLYEMRFGTEKIGVSFGIKNFFIGASSNPSPSGVCSVRYDNFKINAAEKIVERDEI
jgi:hypothetical protein